MQHMGYCKYTYKSKKHILAKTEKLHDQYRALQKSKSRNSESQRGKEFTFKESLQDLFDIAHLNEMEMIKQNEDKEFLIAQRERKEEVI